MVVARRRPLRAMVRPAVVLLAGLLRVVLQRLRVRLPLRGLDGEERRGRDRARRGQVDGQGEPDGQREAGDCEENDAQTTHGLVFSQRVLLALVESGLSRDDAYRLVQRNALRAWDEGLDLRELLEQDPNVKLPSEALDAAFDLDDALKHADVVFDRLSALMTRKEEPVHA